eukprot:695464-Pleurochrysis_carterae.AAC.3
MADVHGWRAGHGVQSRNSSVVNYCSACGDANKGKDRRTGSPKEGGGRIDEFGLECAACVLAQTAT